MAIAARQVQIAKDDDAVVAVERNVVYDPHTGRAAVVENVTAAVDLGDGQIGVARQQRVVGFQAGAAVRSACQFSSTSDSGIPAVYII